MSIAYAYVLMFGLLGSIEEDHVARRIWIDHGLIRDLLRDRCNRCRQEELGHTIETCAPGGAGMSGAIEKKRRPVFFRVSFGFHEVVHIILVRTIELIEAFTSIIKIDP